LTDSRTGAKVLELYEMDDSALSGSLELDFIKLIEENAKNADIIIVTDYGHGLITDAVISKLTAMPVFLALNVQSNAGNRGFNSVSRYPRADFVTLNGAEANLEARRRHADLMKFIPKLQLDLGSKSVLVTLGAGGLDLYTGQDKPVHAPALANYVRDRVGAGDAVLSATALLSKVQAPPEVIGLIGNLVGAWAISFIGNEKSLERGALIKQIVSTLK
jgi:bifunctional ADP-heptose synthase (sugar kinase/adenylyltransferase)